MIQLEKDHRYWNRSERLGWWSFSHYSCQRSKFCRDGLERSL